MASIPTEDSSAGDVLAWLRDDRNLDANCLSEVEGIDGRDLLSLAVQDFLDVGVKKLKAIALCRLLHPELRMESQQQRYSFKPGSNPGVRPESEYEYTRGLSASSTSVSAGHRAPLPVPEEDDEGDAKPPQENYHLASSTIAIDGRGSEGFGFGVGGDESSDLESSRGDEVYMMAEPTPQGDGGGGGGGGGVGRNGSSGESHYLSSLKSLTVDATTAAAAAAAFIAKDGYNMMRKFPGGRPLQNGITTHVKSTIPSAVDVGTMPSVSDGGDSDDGGDDGDYDPATLVDASLPNPFAGLLNESAVDTSTWCMPRVSKLGLGQRPDSGKYIKVKGDFSDPVDVGNQLIEGSSSGRVPDRVTLGPPSSAGAEAAVATPLSDGNDANLYLKPGQQVSFTTDARAHAQTGGGGGGGGGRSDAALVEARTRAQTMGIEAGLGLRRKATPPVPAPRPSTRGSGAAPPAVWTCPICYFKNESAVGNACAGPNCRSISSQTRTASTLAMNGGRRMNINARRELFDSLSQTIVQWFQLKMTRSECQQYFAHKEIGAFVIRKSSFTTANMPTLDWFTLVIKKSADQAAPLHNILVGHDRTSRLFTIMGAQPGQDDLLFDNLQSMLLNFIIDPDVGRRSPVALILPGQSAGGNLLL